MGATANPIFSLGTLAKNKEGKWNVGALGNGGSLKSLLQRTGEQTAVHRVPGQSGVFA